MSPWQSGPELRQSHPPRQVQLTPRASRPRWGPVPLPYRVYPPLLLTKPLFPHSHLPPMESGSTSVHEMMLGTTIWKSVFCAVFLPPYDRFVITCNYFCQIQHILNQTLSLWWDGRRAEWHSATVQLPKIDICELYINPEPLKVVFEKKERGERVGKVKVLVA